MAYKDIDRVIRKSSPHMVGDGFRVIGYLPDGEDSFSKTSPFLVLDYNPPWQVPASDHPKGVGAHPHRGFETVTIVFEGELEHRDSSGAGGRIGAGDVQWMTAASGVLHQEFQSAAFTRQGGVQHMAQIWVNLPARHKMAAPHYQSITHDRIGRYAIDEQGSEARVIAGSLQGVEGPAETYTPLAMYDLHLAAGKTFTFDLPAHYNSMALIISGRVRVNEDRDAAALDFVLFGHAGETIQLHGEEASRILVLGGEPINEPVVSHGPFVMNTREEIMTAMADYRQGRFGTL